MVEFNKSPSVADNTATQLLALAIANVYRGTALADGLTLTAPDDTDLYFGGSTVTASGKNKIPAGEHRTFQQRVDLSQIYIIQNGGSSKTIGLEFTGLGVGI